MGRPELIVENDWPAAVLVKAYDTGTSLTVLMYSAELGRSVSTETIGDLWRARPSRSSTRASCDSAAR